MRSILIALAALAAMACGTKAGTASDTTKPAAATLAPATDVTALRALIDSAQARYIGAATSGDTATLSAMYTDDAIVQEPNRKGLHGRAEIEKSLAATFAGARIPSLKLKTEDLATGGDYAIETGSYEQTVQPKSGKAINDVGKYLVVWKKQADGSWKLFREIYNSDLPPKGR